MTDDDHLTLDMSNLIGGTLVSMDGLIERLAQERSVPRDEVLIEIREFLDD